MRHVTIAALTLALSAAILTSAASAQPHGATDPASGGSMREQNLANPQNDMDQKYQPSNAQQDRQGAGLGQATAMPTPTLNHQMTPNTPPGTKAR